MGPFSSPGLINLRVSVAYTEFPFLLVPKASTRTPVIIIKTRIDGCLVWVYVLGPVVIVVFLHLLGFGIRFDGWAQAMCPSVTYPWGQPTW